MATQKIQRVWIKSKGQPGVRTETSLKAALLKAGFEVLASPKGKIDLCISIGGDGTFLASLRELGEKRFEVPVLGVHSSPGKGFLLPLKPPHEDPKALKKWSEEVAKLLKAGGFTLEERWGLTGRVLSKTGKSVDDEVLWAFNDVVVTRSTLSRLVWLKISVDGHELISKLRGDGFIVSSASGSTGYSLSAGGPVLHPSLKNLVATPVCPQSFGHRTVVLGENSVVRVEVLDNDTPSHLTSDGQSGRDIASGHLVEVKRGDRPVRILVPGRLAFRGFDTFFQVLREKLGFGHE